MVTGLQNCLSQRPLRCACAEGHNAKDLNRPSSVGKNVAVVIVPSTPQQGGHTVVAFRKIRSKGGFFLPQAGLGKPWSASNANKPASSWLPKQDPKNQ